jgi:predicted porin
MRRIVKVALAAASALAIAAGSASAAIVCNNEGDCWHVKGKADFYKSEHGVHVHPDNWKWAQNEHFKWHEHKGHGYWKSGIWIKL